MSYWHAHVEKDGKRLAGSDLDAIEANSAINAARRATHFYWLERRQLFDRLEGDVREIIVVIGEHLRGGNGSRGADPAIGELSAWKSKVRVISAANNFGQRDFDANDSFDDTEVVDIRLAPLPK